jgi:diphthamide biosynthesis enzyme Dph1/Dph2-like protein
MKEILQDEVCWDLQGSVDFVVSNSFSKVALQFPDELLKDAHPVYHELKHRLQAQDGNIQVRASEQLKYGSVIV